MATRYHLFGGDCRTTLGRSAVYEAEDRVRTAIHPSQRPTGMSRRAFGSLVHAPGDGTDREVQRRVLKILMSPE